MTLRNTTCASPPISTSPASPSACAGGWLKRPKTTTAMIAWLPTTPPWFPTPTSSPPATDHRQSTIRCTQRMEPATDPTNVDSAMMLASTAISANGGRPPLTRQAMPTSIAPAPMVAACTG